MKKTFFASLYAVILGLVLSTTWILATPVPAYAGTCSAKCGKKTVTCNGPICDANDGVGCSSSNSNGDRLDLKTCSANTEVELEEFEN